MRTWRWHIASGGLICSGCGDPISAGGRYWVRWVEDARITYSDADEFLCDGCHEEVDLDVEDEELEAMVLAGVGTDPEDLEDEWEERTADEY